MISDDKARAEIAKRGFADVVCGLLDEISGIIDKLPWVNCEIDASIHKIIDDAKRYCEIYEYDTAEKQADVYQIKEPEGPYSVIVGIAWVDELKQTRSDEVLFGRYELLKDALAARDRAAKAVECVKESFIKIMVYIRDSEGGSVNV